MNPSATTGRETVGYIELVRNNAKFRNLWFGQIISLLGDWFNLIGSAALIAKLTGSGLAVGGLFVVRMVAPFLISPIAGVAADRLNRKRLLIITDLARAVTVLGFLLVREPGHVWLLYTLTAVQMAIGGVFFPTRNTIIPNLTTEHEIGAANTLSSTSWSVMMAVGAALGGIVTGIWGIYPAFVIDAVTYLVSAVFITQIRYQWTPKAGESGESLLAAFDAYTTGLRYLRQHVDILIITLQKSALGFAVWGALQVILVVVSQEVFVIGEGGSTSLGVMWAATGVGSGLGPILARRYTGDRHRSLRIGIAIGYGIAAFSFLLIASLGSFTIVVVGLMLRGVGSGVVWVFSTQLLMQLVPDRIRGRVFSTEYALMTLSSAIATGAGGWLLDSTSLGISGVALISVALTLVVGIFWVRLTTSSKSEPTPVETAEVDSVVTVEDSISPEVNIMGSND